MILKILVKTILSLAFSITVLGGARVKIGVSAMQTAIDPVTGWHYLHHEILAPCTQNLVKLDEGGKIYSDLARRWSVSADGREYTFYLRKTEKFHNGREVTAYDMAYSLNRVMVSKYKSLVGSLLFDLLIEDSRKSKWTDLHKGITVKDKFTLVLKLKKQYPTLLIILSNPTFAVIEKKSIESKQLVFSGEYKISKTSDNELQLEPVKKIDAPIFDIKYIKNDKSLLKALGQGELDYVMGFAEDKSFEKYVELGYRLEGIVTMGNLHSYYNTKKIPNKEFRKDLARLIKHTLKGASTDNPILRDSQTFLPENMLPRSYYKRIISKALSLKSFKKKWASFLGKKKFKFYFRREYTSLEYKERLRNLFQQISNNIDLKFRTIAELLPVLQSRNYDLVQMAYFGVIPDLDGFLALLNQDGKYPYGVYDVSVFFDELRNKRFIRDSYKRKVAYENSLVNFENQFYFIPMHDIYFPVLVKKGVSLTQSRFRHSTFFQSIGKKQ